MKAVFFLVIVLAFISVEVWTYKWLRFRAPKVLGKILPLSGYLFGQIVSLEIMCIIVLIYTIVSSTIGAKN